MVESQPSKLLVAGSIPVSRSKRQWLVRNNKQVVSTSISNGSSLLLKADVAQSVERVLGKDEVSGSIPLIGSSDSDKDSEMLSVG